MKNYLFVLSLVILYSCSPTSEPEINNNLSGRVIGRDNDPVSDARIEIEYRYNLTLSKISATYSQRAYTNIKFSIPEMNHVLLWISDYSIDDTVIILMDDTLKAGTYSVIWDGMDEDSALCVSNVYEYHIKYLSEYISDYFLLLNEYQSIDSSVTLNYYALSNPDGSFTIPYGDLAISHDLEFTIKDEIGNLIGVTHLSPIINIWAIHDQHGKAAAFNFELSKESRNYIEIQY